MKRKRHFQRIIICLNWIFVIFGRYFVIIGLLFRLKFAERQIEWTLMDSVDWKIYIREISRADCFCTMIDWVSIVRHSRRRFSDYMVAVPIKIRKRRRARRTNRKLILLNDRGANNAISRDSENDGDTCKCCWSNVSSCGQNFASAK